MNGSTIFIALLVAVLFVAIVVKEIKKLKSGRGTCSCGCGSCGMSDVCHGNQKNAEK